MRKIKFRGQMNHGAWVYGDLIYHSNCNSASIAPDEEHCWPIKPDTVGQFTGHYDVVGTEMYEGDIVSGYFEEDEWPAVVEWDQVTASFVLEGQCSQIRFDEMGGLEIEIVGNIYDNSELLEGKDA